jgi:hypothetical protein
MNASLQAGAAVPGLGLLGRPQCRAELWRLQQADNGALPLRLKIYMYINCFVLQLRLVAF